MLWLLAALQIWVADESDKVRPDARPPAVDERLRVARVLVDDSMDGVLGLA